jgi:hypothetical protein
MPLTGCQGRHRLSLVEAVLVGERARAPVVRAVALAASLVAALDLAYAVLVWAVIRPVTTPRGVLQSIASGLLGRSAYRGGWPTAFLGLALHVFIALTWTLIFLAALRFLPPLRRWVSDRRRAVLVGLGYGALMWLGMDLIVLPLSRARATPVGSPFFFINLAQHALVLGPPIVLLLRAVASRPDEAH